MTKSENLIVRVDPELKKVIDLKATELEITASALVRDLLSTIFLVEYENERFSKFVIEKIEEQRKLLNQIIDNPFTKDTNQIKLLAKENLQNLILIKDAMNNSIPGKLSQSSYIKGIQDI